MHLAHKSRVASSYRPKTLSSTMLNPNSAIIDHPRGKRFEVRLRLSVSLRVRVGMRVRVGVRGEGEREGEGG